MRQHTRVPEHTNDSVGLMVMKEQLYLLTLLPERAKSKGDLSGAKTVTYTHISKRADGPCKRPDAVRKCFACCQTQRSLAVEAT